MNFNPWELLNVWFLAYQITGKLLFVDHWTGEDWQKLLASEDFVEALREIFENKKNEMASAI